MRPLPIHGAAVAALGVANAAPALAAIGPIRRALLPTLAGIGDPGHVALTFDDGPHPDATPELLRLLDGAGVHATFFLLGRTVDEHPEIARAIVAAGHEIGVHGNEHRLLLKRGPRSTRRDLTRAVDTITSVTGVVPQWWRPPYGVGTTVALLEARRLGLRPVLWTCWGRDWTASCTADSAYRAVLRRLDRGGTTLLHDSDHAAAPKCWLATLVVLPAILTTCTARGLRVGSLREHGLPGGPSGNDQQSGRATTARRSFTPEFKAEIVELCQRGDRTVGQVSKDFELTETAVRQWVKQAELDAGTRSDGLTSDERGELSRLRTENRRLREDVDILKRATAFFALLPS